MAEQLPLMAIIGLGALLVTAIGVTITIAKQCESFVMRFTLIALTWAIVLTIIAAVGPKRIWKQVVEMLGTRIENGAVTVGTPTASPTISVPRIATPTPVRESARSATPIVSPTIARPPPVSLTSTPSFKNPTLSPPAKPPADHRYAARLRNQTGVNFHIDIYENEEWLHDGFIQNDTTETISSGLPQIVFRICGDEDYRWHGGWWTVDARERVQNRPLPSFTLYSDGSGRIYLRKP